MKRKLKKKIKDDISINDILKALEIYESEWEHRDVFMRTMIFTMFYATIICDLIPFVKSHFNIESIPISELLFPVVGLFLSVYFLLISISYSARMEAASETIKKIMNLLPSAIQRVKLSETSFGKNKFVEQRIGCWSPLCMFIFLLFIDVVSFNILYEKIYDTTKILISTSILISIIFFCVVSLCVVLFFIKHSKKNKSNMGE